MGGETLPPGPPRPSDAAPATAVSTGNTKAPPPPPPPSKNSSSRTMREILTSLIDAKSIRANGKAKSAEPRTAAAEPAEAPPPLLLPATEAAAFLLESITEDSYFSFRGGPARGTLPPLDWNASCRKAYTILFWMRPVLPPSVSSGEGGTSDGAVVDRYLYRFFTTGNAGVVVSCGQWALEEEEEEAEAKSSGLKSRKVRTTLTARTYDASMLSGSSLEADLALPVGRWSLVGCSHVFPYLKRPQWTLTVNGAVAGAGELTYPQATGWMETNTVLQNIASGGALCPADRTRGSGDDDDDDDKSPPARRPLEMHVASMSLYPTAVSPALQAVLCEAGVVFSTQSPTPWLPPVANWAKGSSIEAGPKVGIPLAVHPTAPQIQQLAGSLLMGVSASHAVQLGELRWTCPVVTAGGSTVDSPRVGLVQPTPPVRYGSPDEAPVLYLSGDVDVVTCPLLECSTVGAPSALPVGRHCSLAWEPLATYLVLPFFLSTCPPGLLWERHAALYEESVVRLHGLYATPLASQLIKLLSRYIDVGGARAVEVVLQDGILHVLASNLRLSLLRAQRGRLFASTDGNGEPACCSLAELQRRLLQQKGEETSTLYNNPSNKSLSMMSPKFIPASIVDACCELVGVCCGPPAARMADLLPADCVRRTSDVALTAIFGLAMETDLWGGHVGAASAMFQAVADRYGGFCVTLGYVLRSQVSMQYFLDTVRLMQNSLTAGSGTRLSSDLSHHNNLSSTSHHHPISVNIDGDLLDQLGRHQSRLVTAMLMASLSNRRSIAQGEHDIASCVNALTDCPLGTLGAHVVLNAIVSILVWCDVLPAEAAPLWCNEDLSTDHNHQKQEEHKMQVASRLGRNLLISQFHTVVAPMVLSRTVFSADSSARNAPPLVSKARSVHSAVSWEAHWRLALVLFSWVASIAGPEGVTTAKSCGGLLLASGLAGSLEGALEAADQSVVSALYLPPPGMAMMIGSAILHDWSYTDLLSDRLSIMMPLLPGLVISLLSHPKYATFETPVSLKSLRVLAELVTAMGGAFHRVFGGTIHQTDGPSKTQVKSLRDKSADSVKAAKDYVPHLLVVGSFLERHIRLRKQAEENGPVKVLRPEVARERLQRIDLESWVEISSTESVIADVAIPIPEVTGDSSPPDRVIISVLHGCEKSVLNTAAGLISNSMSLGGGGAAISVWNHVLLALDETAAQASVSSQSQDDPETASLQLVETSEPSFSNELLCRLISIVLTKALKRHDQWEVWSYEMSSAVAKVCLLIEEKNLLSQPIGRTDEKGTASMSEDQVLLLSTVLEVLTYGRDTTGWCQLALPSMSSSFSDGSRSIDVSAASKLLLPVLEPCFRITINSVKNISTRVDVEVFDSRDDSVLSSPGRVGDSSFKKESSPKRESLLGLVVTELEMTLTAAIVGRSFSAARDMALNAMAMLRAAAVRQESLGDAEAAKITRGLILKVAEELRVRYEGERRLRESALFDAYDDAKGGTTSAVEGSTAIERLILGDTVFGADEGPEEISFESKKSQVSEDFVLFHEPDRQHKAEDGRTIRLGYAQYDGLGASLEECKMLVDLAESHEDLVNKVLAVLAPFLDSWDAVTQNDAVETELVHLFGTGMKLTSRSASKGGDGRHLGITGSESAADAMSTFFEEAATEKARLKDVSIRFLPSQRHSRMAFAERFCWARYMEASSSPMDGVWERGVPDGNRDIRSRIPTIPCTPQFRRFIPKYLDHYSESDEVDGQPILHSDGLDSSNSSLALRRSSVPGEIDAFTKSLLQAGKLEIVDITKQEIVDDEPELPLRLPSGSVDDYDIAMFNEAGEEANENEDSGPTSTDDVRDADEEAPAEDSAKHATGQTIGDIVGKQHIIVTSAFSTPPDNSSSSLSLMHPAAAGMIEQHMDNCLHVRAEGSRQCAMLLTGTHLVLEYEGDPEGFFEGEVLAAKEDADRQKMIKDAGEYMENSPEEVFAAKVDRRQKDTAALRPKSIRWNLSEVSHVYLRRYRLRDSSLEIFFIPSGGASFGGFGMFSPSSSLFLDFGPGHEGNHRRDEAAFAIMHRVPPQAIKQWPDRSPQFLHDQLSRLTLGWVEGRISNFDYLLHLNMLSGRSYNDICQYPVFPWVLSDYVSEEIPDLTDPSNFRDLSKPVGALNPVRLAEFIERFSTFADPSIPPFMYGSHYSTSAGVVLHFLVRLHPFAGLHRQLQSGHFDVADRLFSSVPRTWSMCTGTSAAEVKELIPEFYCNPSFLKNGNNFKLGTSQDGDVLGDVVLPPWAKGSPERFVEVMRAALESEICTSMLPDWIDLIFGKSQQGPEAVKANNVFFYLTYYGSVDVASIEDEALRHATELQIAHFGQCPMQLLRRAHVRRIPRDYHKLSFYQLLSPYNQILKPATESSSSRFGGNVNGEPPFLPFFSAPLSHWVHLDAPPPGPHAPLVAVRFAGADRCLAVDTRGVFHTFRWAWRPEEDSVDQQKERRDFDLGCFVAQRELPRFRSVPRLMLDLTTLAQYQQPPAVAISKTLFAGRSVLLVLSDGDGAGGFGMQLVDPSKGQVRGEAMIPGVHSGRVTCIATDPIGTAAGHGGVGGELVLVGSMDGTASLWRFMSSHYLPLRPRVLLRGLVEAKVVAVALCSGIFLAATLTTNRCSLYAVGNGTLIRTFGPPENTLDFTTSEDTTVTTTFADTPALGLSVQGFVVTVCETHVQPKSGPGRKVAVLHLFTVEGVSLGSKPLESWRGLPHKIQCTPDGTAVLVCCGRGITVHRLSAVAPLEILDEWQITEADSLGRSDPMDAAYDIDLGPSLNRPVVAAAACSNGVLRLHALPGISAWSDRNKKSGITQTVGTALAKPAQRLNRVMREGIGLGRQLAGMGRDIGKEVTSDVKERGVTGFFGSLLQKPKNG